MFLIFSRCGKNISLHNHEVKKAVKSGRGDSLHVRKYSPLQGQWWLQILLPLVFYLWHNIISNRPFEKLSLINMWTLTENYVLIKDYRYWNEEKKGRDDAGVNFGCEKI